MWDLERENCIAQLNLPPVSGSDNAAAPPAVDHIAASCSSPLLYAADTSGTGAAADAFSCPATSHAHSVWLVVSWMHCAVPAGTAFESLPPHLVYFFSPPLLACLPAVRIFDLRSSEVVGSVQHLRSRLAGGWAGWRAGPGLRQLIFMTQRAA